MLRSSLHRYFSNNRPTPSNLLRITSYICLISKSARPVSHKVHRRELCVSSIRSLAPTRPCVMLGLTTMDTAPATSLTSSGISNISNCISGADRAGKYWRMCNPSEWLLPTCSTIPLCVSEPSFECPYIELLISYRAAQDSDLRLVLVSRSAHIDLYQAIASLKKI